jgi:signal transduction histidine kinase
VTRSSTPWVTAPVFEDAARTRDAGLVRIILSTHFMTILIGCVVAPFVAANAAGFFTVAAIWFTTSLVAWVCNQQGRAALAASLAVLPFYVIASTVMLVSPPTPAVAWYLVAVLHLFLVLGARIGLVGAVVAVGITSTHFTGLRGALGLPIVFPHAVNATLFLLFVQMLMIIAPVSAIVQRQRRALEAADAALAQRLAAERALQELNAQLDAQVQARTKELVAANADLEAFSYSVSHDLRSPLNAISGFTSLAIDRAGPALDERSRTHLDRVLAASARMGNLINDLMSLARVSKETLRRTDIDLTSMATAIAQQLSESSPQRQVEWQIAPDLHAQGDLGLIRVALDNLLGNAWKYTAKNTHSVIRFSATAQSDSMVEFLIEDNGVGFENQYAAQLFAPFRRLHSEKEFQGSGIGLATVFRIVARHGGSIRGSGEVDHGAKFWFTLPISQPVSPPTAAADSAR